MKEKTPKVKCTFNGCNDEGRFALYQLRADKTKIWRSDICDSHETLIAARNAELRGMYDIREFEEIQGA